MTTVSVNDCLTSPSSRVSGRTIRSRCHGDRYPGNPGRRCSTRWRASTRPWRRVSDELWFYIKLIHRRPERKVKTFFCWWFIFYGFFFSSSFCQFFFHQKKKGFCVFFPPVKTGKKRRKLLLEQKQKREKWFFFLIHPFLSKKKWTWKKKHYSKKKKFSLPLWNSIHIGASNSWFPAFWWIFLHQFMLEMYLIM